MLASVATVVTSLFGLGAARQIANKRVAPAANARLGMNIAGIADWGTEFPFVDLFKQSRAWFIEGREPENSGLMLDTEGWVTRLQPGLAASTIISSLDNSHFPSGDYVILYDGEGVIKVPNHFNKSATPGRLVVHVNGQKGIFRLDITKINPQNYIKNIRVVLKEHEETYQKLHWNPIFLKRWSGVSCLRFMDLMQTNNSPQTTWESRPKPTDASFATNGVPVEWLVDLANRLNCDAWFCVPHQADDDYVKRFAQYVEQNLKTELRAWVEYSNEVWNGGFNQNSYASKAGQNLKFADKPWEAAWKFNAFRSVQIFNGWIEVFGGTHRLVRVLASQAVYTEVAKQILGFKLPNNKIAAEQADVLAIANYMSLGVSPKLENGLNDKIVADWPLAKLFDYLSNTELPACQVWLEENKKIADEYGLKLVGYEAGQHLVGYSGAENNDKLTALFLQANADKRMGELYAKSLALWQQIGGDLICNFTSVQGWSKWGSWGIQQFHNELPSSKFKAVMDWAKSLGQKVNY